MQMLIDILFRFNNGQSRLHSLLQLLILNQSWECFRSFHTLLCTLHSRSHLPVYSKSLQTQLGLLSVGLRNTVIVATVYFVRHNLSEQRLGSCLRGATVRVILVGRVKRSDVHRMISNATANAAQASFH
jgi:hypothetical protein